VRSRRTFRLPRPIRSAPEKRHCLCTSAVAFQALRIRIIIATIGTRAFRSNCVAQWISLEMAGTEELKSPPLSKLKHCQFILQAIGHKRVAFKGSDSPRRVAGLGLHRIGILRTEIRRSSKKEIFVGCSR